MTHILTKSPHQKIDKNFISSQWEGTHIRFTENNNNLLIYNIGLTYINDDQYSAVPRVTPGIRPATAPLLFFLAVAVLIIVR